LVAIARDLRQLKLPRDELYGVSRNVFVVGIRGRETRLVDGLFSVMRLSSKLKRRSGKHLQRGILLPSMVFFHLSWKRSINI
jgi:hypothetical protein